VQTAQQQYNNNTVCKCKKKVSECYTPVVVDNKIKERAVSFRDILRTELEQEMKKKVDETIKKELDDKMEDVSVGLRDVHKKS